jgi:hypothetical protein
VQGLEEIRFKTNLVIEPVVVESDKLAQSIHKLVEASGALLKEVSSSMEDLEVDLQEADSGTPAGSGKRKAPRSRMRRSSNTCRRS